MHKLISDNRARFTRQLEADLGDLRRDFYKGEKLLASMKERIKEIEAALDEMNIDHSEIGQSDFDEVELKPESKS